VKDLIAELEQVRRRVSAGDGQVVELTRAYDAPVADLWDACTRPERMVRWFLPLSGDLRPGGTYQLEGNAGGRIEACEPPWHLGVTWEFGGGSSRLAVDFTPLGDSRSELRLRHTVPTDDHWREYGPGAVGVGWELALLGLAMHVGGEEVDPAAIGASPEAQDFMRRSAALWGHAHEESGVAADVARAAADRTAAAYAPAPDSAGEHDGAAAGG
jgi:uncharacterized protein YndB with AHSA1/START domain